MLVYALLALENWERGGAIGRTVEVEIYAWVEEKAVLVLGERGVSELVV